MAWNCLGRRAPITGQKGMGCVRFFRRRDLGKFVSRWWSRDTESVDSYECHTSQRRTFVKVEGTTEVTSETSAEQNADANAQCWRHLRCIPT